MPDERPTRQYTCPHCRGMGEVEEDRIEYWPITRPCGYCEGRGFYERPVLPRGAMRAFAVLVSDLDYWWDEPDGVEIVHATSPGKAKMIAARPYIDYAARNVPAGEQPLSAGDILAHMRVRRAPEHDPTPLEDSNA